MTTEVTIKNNHGPDIVLVRDGTDRVQALLPGQEIKTIVCQDFTIAINEADYTSEVE